MGFYLLLPLISILVSCSHTNKRAQEYEAIQLGMVKSEVIEVAGPPHWSDRWKGHDRWTYYLEPEDRQTERVVYFLNGKVVRKGERIKPTISAQEMDTINAPRPPEPKPFKPSLSEAQLRQAIKKELKKEEKSKQKSSVEVIE